VVIPVLYALVESFTQKRKQRRLSAPIAPLIILLFLSLGLSLIPAKTQAQENDTLPRITINEAVNRANTNFPLIKAAQLEIKNQEALKKTAWDIGNTEFSTGAEELGNNTENGFYNTSLGRNEIGVLRIGGK